MTAVLVTPPSEEPVSATEAKLHLRVDHSTDDAMIAAQITAARQWAEAYTKRAFITQTWRTRLDAFPLGVEPIQLYPAPLISVTSVAYVDADGASQTWAGSNYTVSLDRQPGELWLAYNISWPVTRFQTDAVTVTYVCGYGAAAAVPEAIKAAIKLQIGELYANRENSIIGVSRAENPTACALLAPYTLRYLK